MSKIKILFKGTNIPVKANYDEEKENIVFENANVPVGATITDDVIQYKTTNAPVGGTIVDLEPVNFTGLCFTAVEANSTIKLTKIGSPAWTGSYSLDGKKWTSYVPDRSASAQTITLAKVGDKVYFKGDITANFDTSLSGSKYLNFAMTGKIAASGNCNSMYVSDGFETLTALVYQFCYAYMFNGCTSLISVPALPATTLSTGCYSNMFYGCTSLEEAPELPSTTLTNSCYYNMFNGCTSLVKAPELSSTTINVSSYNSMFFGCTSLEEAPALPATVLDTGCYNSMFRGCTSLVKAPELPATRLGYTSSYAYMFYGCTLLNYVKISYTGEFNSNFTDWLNGASATGDFYYNGTEPVERGASNIPSGWTIHTF